jgi:hypothetical protein
MSDSSTHVPVAEGLARRTGPERRGRVGNPAQRAKAHHLVDFLLGSASNSLWPNLDKEQVLAGLHARIDDPDLIEHASMEFLAAAFLARELAATDPFQYALLAALLYGLGWGSLQARPARHIQPEARTRLHCFPVYQGQAMDHADWLVLASLRDVLRS